MNSTDPEWKCPSCGAGYQAGSGLCRLVQRRLRDPNARCWACGWEGNLPPLPPTLRDTLSAIASAVARWDDITDESARALGWRSAEEMIRDSGKTIGTLARLAAGDPYIQKKE